MIDRLLCMIGRHRWREQVVARYPLEMVALVVHGDVCWLCGKHKVPVDMVIAALPESHKWESVEV